MDYTRFVEEKEKEIREAAGKDPLINALSGGADSSVVTLLGHRAVGDQLRTIFIDTGVMRENEPASVVREFGALGIRVELVDAKSNFFAALKGINDPEEKRKAFRHTFYVTLGEAGRQRGAKLLLQGTIAADVRETEAGLKTQHNVLEQIGIDPRSYGFKVLEPLKELYKDQVRILGQRLGLPESRFNRMPFPGPGLAARIVGEVNPDSVAIVRKATRIVEEEVLPLKPFQCFAVLLNDRATGVRDGKRVFGRIVAVRSVESKDAMTATVTELPWSVLNRVRDRILAEIPEVSKVLYDLTPKPPSTIEYV